MLKNKTKFLVILFAIVLCFTTLSFADNEVPVPEPRTGTTDEGVMPINEEGNNNEGTPETPPETPPEEDLSGNIDPSDIHQGDLFLSGTNITLDKLVNGNVYIIGTNVNIKGEIAGNLYVMADTVTLEETFIQSSAYILARKVNFSAVSSDLYVSCGTLNIPTKFGVYRDLNGTCLNANITGIIGRNANLSVQMLSLENNDEKATIYGDLNYSSNSEVTIPEEAVTGAVNFSKSYSLPTTTSKIVEKGLSFGMLLITVLVLFGLAKKFTPKSLEKANNVFSKKWLVSLGAGLVFLITVPFISILLLLTVVGVPVSFLLLSVYTLIIALSMVVAIITIANTISKKFAFKMPLQILSLVGVSIIIELLNMIPFVGPIISVILVLLGTGILVLTMFFKNLNFEKTTKPTKVEKIEIKKDDKKDSK